MKLKLRGPSVFLIAVKKIFFLLIFGFVAGIVGSASIAQADWRKDVGTFRIGLVAGSDIERKLAQVEPFRAAVSQVLGLRVEIFPTKNFRTLINTLSAARIEYAIISASAYATAWKICECLEPLALPRSAQGGEGYNSIVISGKDGLADISSLANARVGALTKSSFAGHLFAAFELSKQGIVLNDVKFEESGEKTVRQFVDGKYDALIGWSSMIGDPTTGYSHGTMRLIAELNEGKTQPFRVIWQSPAIPHRPHVVRKSLAVEAKNLLRELLVNLYSSDPIAYDAIEPNFGGGFVAARHSQFLPIINYVQSLADEPVATTNADKEK